MLIWLMILITVLGTLMIDTRVTVISYLKCKNALFCFKTSSTFWHKENPKETKAIH